MKTSWASLLSLAAEQGRSSPVHLNVSPSVCRKRGEKEFKEIHKRVSGNKKHEKSSVAPPLWLTSIIVENCNANYKTETAQEEHWSCRSKEKKWITHDWLLTSKWVYGKARVKSPKVLWENCYPVQRLNKSLFHCMTNDWESLMTHFPTVIRLT